MTSVGASAFPADLPQLTQVRFFLALGVVLFHYQLQWQFDSLAHTGLIERARLGVDTFFILSGFVLTHAYLKAIDTGRLHYRRFIVARLARIYPAHIAILLGVIGMWVVAGFVGAEFDHEFYNPAGLVLTILMIQAWMPEIVKAEWNGPSWSLSAEWFAYLAFPLFAWLGVKFSRRPILLIALSGIVFIVLDRVYMAVYADSVVHAEANFGILRIIPEFLYGVGLYRLGETLRLSSRASKVASILSAVAMVATMHFRMDDRLIVVLAGALVLSLALFAKAHQGQRSNPLLIEGGEASFALYLVHMPVLIGWKGIASILRDMPSSYDLSRMEVVVVLALTLAAAWAVHRLIERPARDWLRFRIDRRWPSGPHGLSPAGAQPPDV